jgi:hypothetical protein
MESSVDQRGGGKSQYMNGIVGCKIDVDGERIARSENR